jgi:hypothetical protein
MVNRWIDYGKRNLQFLCLTKFLLTYREKNVNINIRTKEFEITGFVMNLNFAVGEE